MPRKKEQEPNPVDGGTAIRVGQELVRPDATTKLDKLHWAAEMKSLGFTWNDIAGCIDMTPGEIQVEVNILMQQAALEYDKDKRGQALALFMGRLDYMLTKLMPAVELGDTKAIDAAVRLTGQQMKLLRLGEDLPEHGVTKTLIIQAANEDETGYIEQLRAVGGR